jgi:hypothetical protein
VDKFEEALNNIDIFCKTLVKKMLQDDDEQTSNITIEPMEKLLIRKNIIEENTELSPLRKSFIPLPQAENPLVDVFEDDKHVKVLMQCRCKDQEVTVHTDANSVEICKRECHTNSEGEEVCTDKCQKLDVPTQRLQVENMIQKCSNNTVFEVDIPKKT